jgi:hypothetical protein
MNEPKAAEQTNRIPLVNLVVGILTFISPSVLHPVSAWSNWDITITGIVIAIVAIVATSVHRSRNYWPAINVLLGIWLLISIVFVSDQPAIVWSNVVLGVTAIVTGLVSQNYELRSRHHAVA